MVASICQKASGSLPKDLSKSSLDSHSCKCGATNCCCVSQSSQKRPRDNKNQRMGDLTQTKASCLFPASPWPDKHHTLFFSYPNYHLVICWHVADSLTAIGHRSYRDTGGCSAILVTQVRSEWSLVSSLRERAKLIVFGFLLHEIKGSDLFVLNFPLKKKKLPLLSIKKANIEWVTPIIVICGFHIILPFSDK